MKNQYNTRQRSEIIKYMSENTENRITAKDILRYFSANHIHIGLTTIYRQLNKLIEEGVVRKYRIATDSSAYFEFARKNRDDPNSYRCICSSCGSISSLQCHEMPHMKEHIREKHGFFVDSFQTVLYGKCQRCEQKSEKINSEEQL